MACLKSGPLSQWWHPTISSSVVTFSSCLQSFLASGFLSNESALGIKWPKYWSFSFSFSPFNEWKWSESESRSVMSDSLRPHGLNSPWNSLGQNTGVGSLSLLQGIFPTQESNHSLLHCRQILYQLSYQGSNIQDLLPLGWTGWISLQSKGLSRVFSNATVWKHQFFRAQHSLWSNSHILTCVLEKP